MHYKEVQGKQGRTTETRDNNLYLFTQDTKVNE